MKLNCDCVRDILLCCEEAFENHSSFLTHEKLASLLPSYSEAEIISALESLDEAGYIICSFLYGDGTVSSVTISKITFEGTEFLEIIRPKSTWEKIKGFISKNAVPSVTKLFELIKIFTN